MEQNLVTPWDVKDMIEALPKRSYLVTTGPVEGRHTKLKGRDIINYESGCYLSVESTAYGLTVFDSVLRRVEIPTASYLNLKVVEASEVGPDTGLSCVVDFIQNEPARRGLWI
jgi:hypothetical protein